MKTSLINFFNAAFLTGICHSATITVGTMDTKDGYPFGVTPGGSALYVGQYQQIYTSSAFPGPMLITQVAFASYFPTSISVDYTLSIGLGVTTRSPASPGAAFMAGITQAFSGPVTNLFTQAEDFDFPIALTTPFDYDPAQGNLILDVSIFSASGTSAFGLLFFVDTTLEMGRIWNRDGTPFPSPNNGLVTEFKVIPAPEPNSIALLLCAAALCLRRGLSGKNDRSAY